MVIYRKNTDKDEELAKFSYPEYEQSDAVKQAQAQLQQYEASQQPAAYQSQYQGQMSSLMSQIENRPEFRYDADGDALYQYYKDRYTQNGQRAMEDTMGQAAALTGGYGSSYAQNVGQQAYNEYMMGLSNIIPELYQLARDRYDRETADLQDRYAMYANLEAQDYSRWQDQRSQYYSELDRLTDNARYEAEQDWSRYVSGYNEAYKKYEQGVNSRPDYVAVVTDGENNNGSVSHENVKIMQRMLGLPEDGYWGSKAYEVTGQKTAEEAWEAYLKGKLKSKSQSGMTMEDWEATKPSKPTVQSVFAGMMTKAEAASRGITAKEWEAMVDARLNNTGLTEEERAEIKKQHLSNQKN